MKKLLKALSAGAAALFAAAALSITVCAEDYSFEITDPQPSNGSWGQAFVHYTANDQGHPGNFDATWITPDSEVIVEYTYEGDAAGAPLELIWQTWEGPIERDPDVKKDWNKIAPYEYDDTTAKFSHADIAAAYGTDNFETVYAINVGDTGVKLTVTGVTITNCEIVEAEETEAPSEEETEAEAEEETEAEAEEETEAATEEETEAEAEEETEAETEEETEAEAEEETEAETEEETEAETEEETKAETEAETTPAETSATTNIADNAPKEGGGGTVVVTVIIVVIVLAAAGAGVFLVIKKNKGKYY